MLHGATIGGDDRPSVAGDGLMAEGGALMTSAKGKNISSNTTLQEMIFFWLPGLKQW